MRKKALQVSLHVTQPSVIELVVGDNVQLDQLLPSPHGYIAERHGSLLAPGTTTLELAQGFYCFKTLSAASLRVVRGGADASVIEPDPKDPWPTLPARATDPAPQPQGRGDDLSGVAPQLTVTSRRSDRR